MLARLEFVTTEARIDAEDDFLKRLMSMGLNLHGGGSEYFDRDLFELINTQFPKRKHTTANRIMTQFAEMRTHQYLTSI